MAQVPSAAEAANYLHVRTDWLARVKEPILEPELPIIDPHHHLWDREGWRGSASTTRVYSPLQPDLSPAMGQFSAASVCIRRGVVVSAGLRARGAV